MVGVYSLAQRFAMPIFPALALLALLILLGILERVISSKDDATRTTRVGRGLTSSAQQPSKTNRSVANASTTFGFSIRIIVRKIASEGENSSLMQSSLRLGCERGLFTRCQALGVWALR